MYVIVHYSWLPSRGACSSSLSAVSFIYLPNPSSMRSCHSPVRLLCVCLSNLPLSIYRSISSTSLSSITPCVHVTRLSIPFEHAFPICYSPFIDPSYTCISRVSIHAFMPITPPYPMKLFRLMYVFESNLSSLSVYRSILYMHLSCTNPCVHATHSSVSDEIDPSHVCI